MVIVLKNKPPAYLTHYTTVSGLIGILQHDSLWASNVSFLNDRRELMHGLDATRQVLEDYSKEHPDLSLSFAKEVIADLAKSKLPDIYAACFCRKDDLLSQWRGYGGKEQGVSITFRGPQLEELFKKRHGTMMEVIYDKERTAARAKNALNKALDNFDDILGPTAKKDKKAKLASAISRLVPRFKDDGFAEENEWRFVIQRTNDLRDVQFRERDGVIVPYLVVSADVGDNLPIQHITVGPGKKQDVTIRSIEILLKAKGYSDVSVRPSSVPYRT
ncbi:DUF2971 domain-containing protein [Agrobacterium tumefaciens]|uniref:DUF2971 domain-containing protein n=1 Tax=Agrobacterium tumefaciens TaxID=358 RepID=UPI001662E652